MRMVSACTRMRAAAAPSTFSTQPPPHLLAQAVIGADSARLAALFPWRLATAAARAVPAIPAGPRRQGARKQLQIVGRVSRAGIDASSAAAAAAASTGGGGWDTARSWHACKGDHAQQRRSNTLRGCRPCAPQSPCHKHCSLLLPQVPLPPPPPAQLLPPPRCSPLQCQARRGCPPYCRCPPLLLLPCWPKRPRAPAPAAPQAQAPACLHTAAAAVQSGGPPPQMARGRLHRPRPPGRRGPAAQTRRGGPSWMAGALPLLWPQGTVAPLCSAARRATTGSRPPARAAACAIAAAAVSQGGEAEASR